MPVSYNQSLSTDMVIAETESLFAWRTAILRLCFYPASVSSVPEIKRESALLSWCSQQADESKMDKRLVDQLNHHHALLQKAAQDMLDLAVVGKMDVAAYDALEQNFLGYVTQVEHLQHEHGPAAANMDMGLRNAAEMRNDVKREQDRYDRKGASFSVAAISVDDVVSIHQKYDLGEQNAIFTHIGKMIAQAVRSFDDAYYTGNGSYLLVLKHIDFLDACSVMDRLRGEVEKKAVPLPNGDEISVTASFGVAQAQEKEDYNIPIDAALDALKKAIAKGGNCVEEHHEISSLARYVKEKDV